jgi:hypothetical protein
MRNGADAGARARAVEEEEEVNVIGRDTLSQRRPPQNRTLVCIAKDRNAVSNHCV